MNSLIEPLLNHTVIVVTLYKVLLSYIFNIFPTHSNITLIHSSNWFRFCALIHFLLSFISATVSHKNGLIGEFLSFPSFSSTKISAVSFPAFSTTDKSEIPSSFASSSGDFFSCQSNMFTM